MKTIVIEASSLEEALKGLKKIFSAEDEDDVRGEEISNAKYNEFINLTCDLCRNIIDSGVFEVDVEVFRKHLLEMPLRDKRAFFLYHSSLAEELVENICGLTKDYILTHKETVKVKEEPLNKEIKKTKKKTPTKEKRL